MDGDGAKGQEKGKRERRQDQSLMLALMTSSAPILGKHGERKQELQGRKEGEREGKEREILVVEDHGREGFDLIERSPRFRLLNFFFFGEEDCHLESPSLLSLLFFFLRKVLD